MLHSLRLSVMIVWACVALIAMPFAGEVQARTHKSDKTESTASTSSRKSAKASKRRSSSKAKSAKAVRDTETPQKRHRRKASRAVPVPVENEEGDVGASCTVPRLTVKSAVLWNMTTGEMLYEQNPDVQIAPASLTKVLTLYILFDAIRQGRLRPWDVIDVSARAATQGGSNMRLRTGETVKVTELIKGIAVASANDACMAMADSLENGNVDAFVALMNNTAKRLGMSNSVFFNPNGLPADGQVTTAHDMLKLAVAYLEQFPKALTIHSMQFFTHNNRQRHNANSLLGNYEGADGLKTGFVCSSGYNIIATAKRGDTRLIAVVLGSRNARVRQRETAKLLDKGFAMVRAKQTAKAAAKPAVLAATPGTAAAGASSHP